MLFAHDIFRSEDVAFQHVLMVVSRLDVAAAAVVASNFSVVLLFHAFHASISFVFYFFSLVCRPSFSLGSIVIFPVALVHELDPKNMAAFHREPMNKKNKRNK